MSWVPGADGSPFDVHNLPYGVFSHNGRKRVGAAIGAYVYDLAPTANVFDAPTLNPFLAQGRAAWREVRAQLTERLTDEAHRAAVEPHLIPRDEVTLHLPFEVADYVDFYASEHHASNLGRYLRPNEPPLMPNWKHLPVGYHGRAGTVVVSGTPIVRPCGQHKADTYGPTQRLDIEVEVGFVVGTPSQQGERVPVDSFADHVFGVVLVNDWSARDLQAWEGRPLGPFLAKSFATSISPWVVPLDALNAATLPTPSQDPTPLPYLQGDSNNGLDIDLELRLNGVPVSRPRFRDMYWTPAQMLAHLTVNGASLRTGDLFASGTVSGPTRKECGSLYELSLGGNDPLRLPDGTERAFLHDGDAVTITATAPGPGGTRLGFGEVTGRIAPAQ
jgi:fumarylacetoacetase